MKIVPTYQFSVLQEEEFQEKMSAISEQLDACRQEGTFAGRDGKQLYYEYFQAEECRGAVVVVHGLSEFTAKYHEFAWYLLNQGYDVFLYDQRCHGRSCRLTSRQDMIHVDKFSHYVDDLDLFIRNVVTKATNAPLYLYSHSMGGAVAALYLARFPGVFQKALMSAPMVLPLTGDVSPAVARLGLSVCTFFGDPKKKFWGAREFDPDYPFERSQDRSLARFRHNMDIRLADARFRTTPLTMGWVYQSLLLHRKLIAKSFTKKLTTPILMLSAEDDRVVSNDAQQEFAESCSVCRRVIIPGSTHSMLWGTTETITAHLRQVLDHFV